MSRRIIRRFLPCWLISSLKKVRGIYRSFFSFYETRVAPFIAFQIPFILVPLYKLCTRYNICFLANIPDSDGVGHILVETDQFLRRKFLGELDLRKQYVLVKRSHPLSKQFARLYRHHFDSIICNSFLYYLTLPLIMRFETLRIDCGLSRSKWHPIDASDAAHNLPLSHWPKIIAKTKNLQEWDTRSRRRVASSHFFPLKDCKNLKHDIDHFVPPMPGEKIALVHLKTNISNATAKITDPETYLPTLRYLTEQGFKLVFFGREKMPREFNQFDIKNYAQSPWASFRNDVALFNRASLAIMGGSGAFLFADCMNVPLLYLNSWHLFRLPAAKSCVYIPTVINDKKGTPLSFVQQWRAYQNAEDAHAELFDSDCFEARNASADEIFEGCLELLDLIKRPSEMSREQQRFNELSEYYFGQSRISSYFLQKHAGRGAP